MRRRSTEKKNSSASSKLPTFPQASLFYFQRKKKKKKRKRRIILLLFSKNPIQLQNLQSKNEKLTSFFQASNNPCLSIYLHLLQNSNPTPKSSIRKIRNPFPPSKLPSSNLFKHFSFSSPIFHSQLQSPQSKHEKPISSFQASNPSLSFYP